MPSSIQRLRCAALAAALAFLFVGLAQAQPSEAEVKAAFIFNFAQYVEWPSQANSDTNAPFVIGVSGSPSVHEALTAITRGEKVRGHRIEVKQVRSPAQAAQTHIFLCGASEAARWPEFRRALQNAPVLTVGDMDGFARRGGMIEFFRKETKVRFRANPAEAKGVGLNLSAKLLRLAEIAQTEPN